MKTGRSLVDIAKELERQKESKKDYVVATKAMKMGHAAKYINLGPNKVLSITPLAHKQLGTKLNIPSKYYELMRTQMAHLLAINVNHWLFQQNESRLVRTIDGKMRAFLSKRYRCLDNFDLSDAVLPTILEANCIIRSCEVTENKFYIKATTNRIQAEVVTGDVVEAGICISNSEVGLGRISVEPLIYRLVCDNGMIARDYGIKRNHVGRNVNSDDAISEYYRDDTLKADDKAFWMKIQDTVKAVLSNRKLFDVIVDKLHAATCRPLEGDPIQVVENVSRRFNYGSEVQSSILSHLIAGGTLSQYGLSNAVTAASQDVTDYDKCTDMEHHGHDIIELTKSQWNVLNYGK